MSGKVEAAGTVATKAGSYVGSGTLIVIGGLTAQEIAALIGVALGVATFAVNWVYQHRRDRRELTQMQQNVSQETEDDHRVT